MAFFEQRRFPRLWLFIQDMIGGKKCKQSLATKHYRGQKRVLEIGCSVGNISSVFCAFPDIDFTGIDIDSNAIGLARRRFRNYPNFSFSLTSLEDLAQQGKRFDYVLFASILHHVNDDDGVRLLRDAVKCTASGGHLVICEPEALRESDGWFLHFFYANFEQGRFLRFREELIRLVERAGVALQSVEDQMISSGIVKRPYSARFNLLVGTPANNAQA